MEWEKLHVVAEKLSTLSKCRQEDQRDAWVPGFFKYQTAFVARLDVKTAFDVAKPSVVSRLLTHMETHAHVVATLLEEVKDLRGSACFENCETEFRFSGRI